MPEGNDSTEATLSQLTNETRNLLLQALQAQLDELVADKLVPQTKGVPFINFKEDPPQVVTLKKVINCLYHAEEGFKHWESVDRSSVWGWAKGAKPLIEALIQVYKALGMLDDATPEIRKVIADNYNLLEPIFTRANQIIKDSGWMPEFMEMGVTDQASKIILQGMDLLGPDPEQWNNSHPIISSFTTISKLIETVSSLQDKDLSKEDNAKAVELVRSLLNDLESNPFFAKWKISDLENSKAIQDLLMWFKNIEEDGYNFTKKNIQQYVSWANHYLPILVGYADQLEQQNYLKSGILSSNLSAQAERLSQQANTLLSESGWDIPDRVIPIEALTAYREQQINSRQTQSVQAIIVAEKQQSAAVQFYQILRPYQGMPFEAVIESDRTLLRKLYSKVQMELAHSNLDLENQFASMLNTIGPENLPPPKKWWQNGLNYLAGYVVSPQVDKLLKTEGNVAQLMSQCIASEKFKITIAEKSRGKLSSQQNIVNEKELEEKVNQRIQLIKSGLTKQNDQVEINARITPVKAEHLINLRGTLTAIQKMELSNTVKDTRNSLIKLIGHLPPIYQSHFSNVPYKKEENDPDVVKQIKDLEKNLFQLEDAIRAFEGLDLSYGIMIRLTYFVKIASAAADLKASVMALSSENQKMLAPLLQQITTYTQSFSDISNPDDLSSLQKLKTGVSIKPQSIETPTERENSDLANYVKQIKEVRTGLLHRFQTNLSTPISSRLKPQEEGVPFVELESDPPQVAAIKKIINSLYYAESALKAWSNVDTSTQFGKIAAAHQGVAALSQVYKSIGLFTEASVEVQALIRENEDLIAPIFQGANNLVMQSGWTKQFSALDVAKKAGSIIGQGINAVQPKQNATQTSSLVRLLSELPTLMNNISSTLDPEVEKSTDKLRISDKRISDIGALFEMVFEENGSYTNLYKGFSAILGIIDLNCKFQREATHLQETTIQFYQEWLEEGYPNLIIMLDEIETRHYLPPGTLSKSLSLEIDQINDKLNEIIEGMPDAQIKQIPLSFDMGKMRRNALNSKKSEHLLDMFQVEKQQESSHTFFEILKRHSGTLGDIPPNERVQLRLTFANIQMEMANCNLDVTNQFITDLNLLETATSGTTVEAKTSISSLMKLEPLVTHHLGDRKKYYELKVEVNNEALKYVKSKSFDLQSAPEQEINIPQLRQRFLTEASQKPSVGPGELKVISVSSLTTPRGNLAYIQELNMSSAVVEMRKQFNAITQKHFSERLQTYLNKPLNEPLHVINDKDPHMVRQIKSVENGLYHLEMALKQFEEIKKDVPLISQVKALFEITHHAQQLKSSMEKLSPELQEHYGPLIKTALTFSKKIQSIDYNKEDLADLKFILNKAHNELLKRKTPRKAYIEQAFIEAGVVQETIISDPNEASGKKAAKLGVKYSYLASPELEKARNYLRSRYQDVFGPQPNVVRSLSREQLGDEKYMQAELNRLKDALERNYGFNFTTAKVLFNLIGQIQRAGAQTAEIVGMVNTLVTEDFSKVKENNYKELMVKLSQEEDYLCLKPGTLLNPAMAAINQVFLSAALELDMPFNKKLSILDDAKYVQIILDETQQELHSLEQALANDSSNHELLFNINVKKDKISHLQQQIDLFKTKDMEQTKSSLLDLQFEVILRDHLEKTTIKSPIIQQYEREVRNHYNQNKTQFLSVEECAQEIQTSLDKFQKDNIANYLIVYESYIRLHKFSLKLPEKHQDLKTYIDGIKSNLVDKEIPIEQRALKAKSLPNDPVFIKKLSSAAEGISFLKKFKQFFQIISSSIYEAIKTGGNLVYIYRQKQMEQSIKNIEKKLDIKEIPNSMVILTDDLILEEISSFARAHFQSKINKENKESLKEAFDDYVANTEQLSEENKTILASLNIPKEKLHEFELYLSNKYGEQYTDDFQKLVHSQLALKQGNTVLSEFHALKMDEITGLSQMLHESPGREKQKSTERGQVAFFRESLREERNTESTLSERALNLPGNQ